MKAILAVGDCIMTGAGSCLGNSYPERIGRASNITIRNCGKGMCTSREGMALLRDNLSEDYDCIVLQFGLVDAYTTFKYSPYVLYYPDNFIRKLLRNIVKKYKKTCRNIGLNESLGELNVVPKPEYRVNFLDMIRQCQGRTIVLPETIPHQDAFRNQYIKEYNKVLEKIVEEHSNCHLVRLFDDFLVNMPTFYLDKGHPNSAGCDFITDRMLSCLDNVI